VGFRLRQTYQVFDTRRFVYHPSSHDMLCSFGVTDIDVSGACARSLGGCYLLCSWRPQANTGACPCADNHIMCAGSDGSVRYFKRRFRYQ
jgi:hypothetical protein